MNWFDTEPDMVWVKLKNMTFKATAFKKKTRKTPKNTFAKNWAARKTSALHNVWKNEQLVNYMLLCSSWVFMCAPAEWFSQEKQLHFEKMYCRRFFGRKIDFSHIFNCSQNQQKWIFYPGVLFLQQIRVPLPCVWN